MPQTYFNIEAMPFVLVLVFFVIGGLVALMFMAFMVWLHCKVFTKAGYSWAFGLLVLVPFGQLIVLLILAFGQWPIHQQMQILSDQSNSS